MMKTIAGRISLVMGGSSNEVEGRDENVNGLNADERHDDAAQTIDEEVATQERSRTDRSEGNSFERQWDQRDDDKRVENDGRQNGALRRLQAHDVERLQLRVEGEEHRRNDGEVLGHVVGDRKGGERATRHQELLADFYHLDELGWVGVKVDHV